MNAEERLAYLLELVWVPTNATITVSEIASAVGSLDAARLVVGTLQAGASQDPILAASYQALSTVGMSLSGADRQELIDQLAIAGNWPDAVRDAVKALGGVWQTRWQIEGYASQPTLESVQVELDAKARMKAIQDARKKWDLVAVAIRSQIETGVITDGDVIAAFSQAWSAE